ncbi:MAG: ADP-ribosylglycohydrolase family protein [Desulfobacterales bacterium]|nr:ADP-ribosylglycohydrolase family protein [Desulfobacterales bacterium]
MEEKIRASIMAGFVADALSLGVHWVYDTKAIQNRYGRLTEMTSPELADYHQGKAKGEFTHYGDQALVLLQSLAQGHIFELKDFSQLWQALFEDYTGYVDHATRETLDHFKRGSSPMVAGAVSLDLGGAARIFPLGLLLGRGMERSDFVRAAMDQTRMTHNTPQVVGVARLLAETYARVVDGQKPVSALEEALEHNPDLPLDISALVKAALRSRDEESSSVIAEFGPACSWDGALAGAVHLLARYEDDLETALVENIMAGGDSAARGIPVAWLLGAHDPQGLPQRWCRDLAARGEIEDLIRE